jgi:dipeptidase E
MGFQLDSIHDAPNRPLRAIESAEAIFVGGGNTFRLLRALWQDELIAPIRRRVLDGMPYIGSSAGSNVACPTIKTTNDMPIVEPPSLAALGLVPFNINPHYLDPIAGSTHMGETRDQRIAEFHEENDPPVVGLREGGWLVVEDGRVTIEGTTGARIFRRGAAAVDYPSGSRLDFLMTQAYT